MSIELGERFTRSLAAKDSQSLKALLAPDVDFKGLTPSRAWESGAASAVVDEVLLGTWFSPDRRIEKILAVECDDSGPVTRLRYRLAAALPDGDYVIEQQAYLRAEGDSITWLRILCSGYVKA
jgi:hypothetical protein